MQVHKYFILCLFYFFLVFQTSSIKAQAFRHFSEKDKVPLTTVLGITQDKQGFMWFATTLGLYRYDSRVFKKYNLHTSKKSFSDYVACVFCDSKGRIWIGSNQGLSLYVPERDAFVTCQPKGYSSNIMFNCIYEDHEHRLWGGTSQGLFLIEEQQQQLLFTNVFPNKMQGKSKHIRGIAEGNKGKLWLATEDGLVCIQEKTKQATVFHQKSSTNLYANHFYTIHSEGDVLWLGGEDITGLVQFDTKTEQFEEVKNYKNTSGKRATVYGIIKDDQQGFWLATQSGLANYDPATEKIHWYVHEPENPYSLPDDVLYSVYKDSQGGIWLGAYYLGISYFDPSLPTFAQWPAPGVLRQPSKDTWVGITKEGKGWFLGGDTGEMLVFDETLTKPILSTKIKLKNTTNVYRSFYLSDDLEFWCGGISMLTRINLKTGAQKDFPYVSETNESLGQGRIYGIHEDKKGNLWVAGKFGLLQFHKATGHYTRIPIRTSAGTIMEDKSGNLWVGGKNYVFRRREKLEEFFTGEFQRNVCRMIEDNRGRIWMANGDGIQRFDPVRNKFMIVPFSKKVMETLGIIVDIQEDNLGYLWINGESKIIRYNPEKGTMQTYGYRDGLPFNAILGIGYTVKDRQGNFYFNTNKGVMRLNPGQVSVYKQSSPLVLTSLKLFNEEVTVGDSTGILKEALNTTRKLVFTHTQDIFTLNFALLSYLRSEGNRYAYQLEGFEKNWNYVETPSATYTNLPSGEYTFLVKAANGDGYWNSEPLRVTIVVLPPWWRTWTAYVLYFLILTGLAYLILRFLWLRNSVKKENELYQAKLDFFTNVSHEIRTHLSLINGPLEKVYQALEADPKNRKDLAYAKNNSERLMNLVNELLDFRRMQKGAGRLQVSQHDVVKVLKTTLSSFEHLASEKGIRTELVSSPTPVRVWIDLAQIQKVFYNLLSNAYKFTAEGGAIKIIVTEDGESVWIEVRDNGMGIAPEYLSRLFQNFFQVNSRSNTGYGIGLALSKEIVDHHQGELTVKSKQADGNQPGETSFTVRLLKGEGHFLKSELRVENESPYVGQRSVEEESAVGKEKTVLELEKTLLLIEDNEELRAFTAETFRASFQVIEADNGVDGLSIASEQLPDLIICDVMMPGLSGLEVCKQLKASMLTSHIPIILLTARGTVPQVIEGLQAGADDYLIKPFDFRVLELKIQNLLKAKEVLKQQLLETLLVEKDSQGEEKEMLSLADQLNQEFIDKMKNLVLENVSDMDFGVNEIAYQMGISVSALYRKLRSLTGLTVNDIILEVRMTQAYKLLETGVYNVNEVAFMVGFGNSRYFSIKFKEKYGITPREVKK